MSEKESSTRTRILVIEDNEQNMYLTTFLLEKNGLEVIQAWDGREGIELALLRQPSLILLDIQLPIMDGYSVARALKDDPATRNIPIVAITSFAMAGDRERGLAAGCAGYIEKPIDPDSFVESVTRFLGREDFGSGGIPGEVP